MMHRNKCGRTKWRETSGVLCDQIILIELKKAKGKFSKTAFGPAVVYGFGCWAIDEQIVQKLALQRRDRRGR